MLPFRAHPHGPSLAARAPERSARGDYMGAGHMRGNRVEREEFEGRMFAADPYEDPILWDR